MSYLSESVPYPQRNFRPARSDQGLLRLSEHAAGDRAQAEEFIAHRFRQAFGSSIQAFMPRLFTLRGTDGAIQGALGLRTAQQDLFLEQYLDLAVEEVILQHTGQNCDRRAIVEVGHFSGTFPGAVRTMIGQLTQLLAFEGFEWVVFTGTRCLRNAFGRMGLAPIEIKNARPDRLPSHEQFLWGTYYLQSPHVYFGNIGEGRRALALAPAAGSSRMVGA